MQNSGKNCTDAGRYDCIKLENQLCFPLYVCSKEIVRRYKPFLDELELTYTQYIAMMVLWEHGTVNVRQLGEYLYLDSGTLTPVLKTLEGKGYVQRKRCETDERSVIVAVTDAGMEDPVSLTSTGRLAVLFRDICLFVFLSCWLGSPRSEPESY